MLKLDENLKQYSVKCRIINGIETYIIPPEHYDKISKLLGKAEYLVFPQ